MLANVLTENIAEQLVVGGADSNSFSVEVYNNYVTVDRKHHHTSLIESKTIKVEKDVIVYLKKQAHNVYQLQCKWLWREPTIFENLSYDEGIELQQVITQIATSLRQLEMSNHSLDGIQVGKQVWARHDISLDLGLESYVSRFSSYDTDTKYRLYTYTGAQKIEANYPDWRIPTVQDFVKLSKFFGKGYIKELLGNLNFGFYGFHSKRIPHNEMTQFLNMNPALKAQNGGFYWTSDLKGFDPQNEQFGNRSYIYFNRLTQKVCRQESVNANDNFFSLRLIRR